MLDRLVTLVKTEIVHKLVSVSHLWGFWSNVPEFVCIPQERTICSHKRGTLAEISFVLVFGVAPNLAEFDFEITFVVACFLKGMIGDSYRWVTMKNEREKKTEKDIYIYIERENRQRHLCLCPYIYIYTQMLVG